VTAQTTRNRGGEARDRVRHAGSSLPVLPLAQRHKAVRYIASAVALAGGEVDDCRELLDTLGLDARDGTRRR
jgi:hypothetical protein